MMFVVECPHGERRSLSGAQRVKAGLRWGFWFVTDASIMANSIQAAVVAPVPCQARYHTRRPAAAAPVWHLDDYLD